MMYCCSAEGDRGAPLQTTSHFTYICVVAFFENTNIEHVLDSEEVSTFLSRVLGEVGVRVSGLPHIQRGRHRHTQTTGVRGDLLYRQEGGEE